MTEVHSKIDAIIGELEKASKTHANQAKKLQKQIEALGIEPKF